MTQSARAEVFAVGVVTSALAFTPHTPTRSKEPIMATKFQPVKLVKGKRTRTAQSADEETNLRYNGWRSAPSTAPKAPSKPDAK